MHIFRLEDYRLQCTDPNKMYEFKRDILWPPYRIGQAIIFLPCGFFLSSSIFLSFFPRLISAAADRMSIVYHTSTIHTWCGPSANLECRCEMWCTRLAGNTGRKKSPFWHHGTTLLGYIFTTKACIDNRKKNLSSSNTNMVNFGPLYSAGRPSRLALAHISSSFV